MATVTKTKTSRPPTPAKLTLPERQMIDIGLGLVRGKFDNLARGERWQALREHWEEVMRMIDERIKVRLQEPEPWFDVTERLILRAAVDAFTVSERSCQTGLRHIGKDDLADELEAEAERWQTETRPKFQEQMELVLGDDADVELVK
jgi:hypothetical protein